MATPDYDFIISNKSVEMNLAKEFYNWERLDKADAYYYASDILRLYNFFVANKHRLVN